MKFTYNLTLYIEKAGLNCTASARNLRRHMNVEKQQLHGNLQIMQGVKKKKCQTQRSG